MKVTMIIGEPAVGKSFVMKRFMKRMGNWIFYQPKWTPYHLHMKNARGIVVLGRYDDPSHTYPGTDRMSMAAQPKVIQMLIDMRNNGMDAVLFEGDRLSNDSMIKVLQHMGVDYRVLLIEAPATHYDRKRPEQSNTFRMSRRTKIKNMTISPIGRLYRTKQTDKLVTMTNDTPEQADAIVEWLMSERI